MRGKLICLVLPVFLFMFLLTSCSDSETSSRIAIENMVELEPVIKSKGDLRISVDPRIELLVSVQLLSGYSRLSNQQSKYGKEMKNFFNRYNDHAAIKNFKLMASSGFTYDAPPTAVLFFGNPLLLEQHTAFTPYLLGRGGGENKMNLFFNSLQNFAVQSDFETFYNEQKDSYATMVNSVYDNLAEIDLVDNLESYYRMKKDEYNIILSPLLHGGGYGPQIEASDGTVKIYGIVGPNDFDESGLPQFSTEFIQYLVWHEFSHSFVNPLTEQHLNEVNEYRGLYKPIAKKMKDMAYGSWDICVNEHIVRAVTTRLAYLNEGRAEGDDALRNEKAQGFAYIEALCEKLEDFENNRDMYSTFEDFYPELIQVFKELSKRKLGADFYDIPFNGPINAAMTDKEKVVIIVSTHETEEAANKEIQKYAKIIRDQFFPGNKIYTDEEALMEDLSENAVFAYGTIEGNSWLSKYSSEFPFTVESDKIIAGTVYEGNNFKLISALPNPQNKNNALVLYTAQNPWDIVNINNVFHGPTDYTIIKGAEEIIADGNYEKSDERWCFYDIKE